MDKTSMTLGYLVGRQIAGQRKAKEPVGYMYGDTERMLPDIYKVYTKELQEQYPYVFIMEKPRIIPQEETLYITADPTMLYHNTGFNVGYNYKSSYVTGEGWQEWVEATEGASVADSNIQWANFDLLNEDGSIYLPKSDPIPVYE